MSGTPGAEYHPDFATGSVDIHVLKGQGEASYSAFEGSTEDGLALLEVLARNEVTHVDIVGIATDYCVRASALDALAAGLQVTILTGFVAGVAGETSAAALNELADAGAELQ